MTILSEALQTPFVSDIVSRNFAKYTSALDFRIYWIPRPSELDIKVEVRDKDPFIAASLFGKKFLVAQWDVENEQPFRHYLAEFSGIVESKSDIIKVEQRDDLPF
jgi:hypothetical protein